MRPTKTMRISDKQNSRHNMSGVDALDKDKCNPVPKFIPIS